jgi:hypothetical protein
MTDNSVGNLEPNEKPKMINIQIPIVCSKYQSVQRQKEIL